MVLRNAISGATLAVLSLGGLAGCGSDEPCAEATGTTAVATIAAAASTTAAATTTSGSIATTTAATTSTSTVSTTSTSVAAPAVFDFVTAEQADGWQVVNDTVMGGVSNGELAWTEGVLTFTGELSLENNGGFASIRSPGVDPRTAAAWATRAGVRIEADGDGRTWTVELRTDRDSGGWIATFTALPDTTTIAELPWSAFQPVTRFLEPRNADAPLDPTRLVSVAFFLVDGIEGPFRLGLRSIG